MTTALSRPLLVPPVQSANPLERWNWVPQPQAQSLLNELVSDFLERTPAARALADRMLGETGTRFIDWIDFLEAPGSADVRRRAAETGWTRTPELGAPDCHTNFRGVFPRLVFGPNPTTRVGLKVDSVVDFMRAEAVQGADRILGRAGEQLRMVVAAYGDRTELLAVERHGYRGFAERPMAAHVVQRVLHHAEEFQTRRREFEDDDLGLDHTEALVDAAVSDLGSDLACDLFFEAERRYWTARNRAAIAQKVRQDRLGLGWANHDHHTYRCSRANFRHHIHILEALGLQCRERFYAGSEAGWGAQVMEHPVTGIITFNDVDLSPTELMTDFAHERLTPRKELGTVGLWCGLHGDSVLESGMHHLEAMFSFESLRGQLEREHDVRTMAPFTAFPFLRQAFTEGERWPVREWRLRRLVERGFITAAQAEVFRRDGAIGSHLENLERNDGFKGFNQSGVSEIISRTDPRRASKLSTVEAHHDEHEPVLA